MTIYYKQGNNRVCARNPFPLGLLHFLCWTVVMSSWLDFHAAGRTWINITSVFLHITTCKMVMVLFWILELLEKNHFMLDRSSVYTWKKILMSSQLQSTILKQENHFNIISVEETLTFTCVWYICSCLSIICALALCFLCKNMKVTW